MPHDPRVDAYIANSAPFAQPILAHLRGLVHAAAPDIKEAIKWGMPMFLHADKIVSNIAAFKAHAAFGTWQRDAGGKQEPRPEGMGRLGKITGLADLPSDDDIVAMVRVAMAQVDAGGSLYARRVPKPPLDTPPDLRGALDAVAAAAATFDAFPPSCRREYVEWVNEAKQPATRLRRIGETVAWCAEGKRRNWKHETC